VCKDAHVVHAHTYTISVKYMYYVVTLP